MNHDFNVTEADVPASAVPDFRSEPMDLKRFAEWLKELRAEKGLTLAELGSLTGYSTPHLSQIETGKKKHYPTPELLALLADALGVRYSGMLRMAGYADLAKGVKMKEAEDDFADVDFEEDYVAQVRFLEAQLKAMQGMNELRNLLGRDAPPFPTYNGHKLTPQERHRVLTVLEALFPDYKQPPAKSTPGDTSEGE